MLFKTIVVENWHTILDQKENSNGHTSEAHDDGVCPFALGVNLGGQPEDRPPYPNAEAIGRIESE